MMKKVITLFVFLLFNYFGFAQFDSVQVSHNYSYSETDQEPYGLKRRSESHFDSIGRNISGQSDVWDGYKFNPQSLNSYSYNSAGLTTEILIQKYVDNNWVNDYRTINYYNLNNQIDSSFNQSWQNLSWQSYLHTYNFYNPTFHLILHEKDDVRFYYSPDATDKDTLITEQNLINGVWTDIYQTQIFYDASGKKEYSVSYISPTSGIWTLNDSVVYSYYLNDSLFLTKKYTMIDTSLTLSNIDSIVYSADTLFKFYTALYPPDQSRSVYFTDGTGYNYYDSPIEYFDGTDWYPVQYSICTYDSSTLRAHYMSQMDGSYSESDLTFDSDGHRVLSSGLGTNNHSGNSYYYDNYYYYYLTIGTASICPGVADSLWVRQGMNSYSWNVGGTNSSRQISSDGQYYCTLVNQYGHTFQSEPHYVLRLLSPTVPRAIDSTIAVCSASNFKLQVPYLPIYNYQWFRNDTAIAGANSSVIQFLYSPALPKIDGRYQLVVSNECGSDSSSTTQIQFSHPPVKISPSGTSYICPNDTLIQIADSGFVSYTWEQGENTQNVRSYSGHFNTYVTATDSMGCTSFNRVNVYPSISPNYLPLNFYQPYDSVLRSTIGFSGTYQWYLNGDTIPGGTSYQTVINQSGYYKYSFKIGICIHESVEKYIYSPFRIFFSQDTAFVCMGQIYPLQYNWFQVKGGIPPFHYQWSPSIGLSNDTIFGPALTATIATNYSLTVTDSTGTIRSDTIYVLPRSPVPISLTASRDSVCALIDNNSYDTLRVTNAGSGWYSWYRDGQAANLIGTNTQKYTYRPGTYWVIFNNGCYNYSDTLVIGQHEVIPTPIIRLESTPSDWCQTDSVILIADISNSEKYTYLWRDWSTTNYLPFSNDTVTGYSGDAYSLVITDSTGCHQYASFNLQALLPDSIVPFNLNLTGVIAACYGDTIALQSASYPGWNYQWFNYENDLMHNSPDYTAVYSGQYKVMVDNGFGCHGEASVFLSFGNYSGNVSLSFNGNQLYANSNSLVNSWLWFLNDTIIPGVFQNHYQPQSPGWYKVVPTNSYACGTFVDSVFISCALATTKSDASCYQSCDGVISVLAQGAGPFSLLWYNGDTTNMQSNLCRGTYFVQLTDANNCLAADSVSINEPWPLNVSFSGNSPSCYQSCDGTISANVTGGSVPYFYSWSTGGSDPVLSSLCEGTYDIIISDQHGCTTSSSRILQSPQVLAVQSTIQNASCQNCNDGNLQLNISGGVGLYSILWDTGDTTSYLSALFPGDYIFCITDANGCSICDTLSLGFGVSIREISSNEILVYPNPTNLSVTLIIPANYLNEQLYVFLNNYLGQKIYSRDIQERQIEINTEKLFDGVYFLELRNEGSNLISRKKVVVMH